MILAIDPGTVQSGWVLFDGLRAVAAGINANEVVLGLCASCADGRASVLAIEKIEGMGMAVGKETFETVHWSGRFYQAWPGLRVARITRREVKLMLCGSMRAKDPNVRQALIDELGAPGTKKAPGPTYGVSSHAWTALAVAFVASRTLR